MRQCRIGDSGAEDVVGSGSDVILNTLESGRNVNVDKDFCFPILQDQDYGWRSQDLGEGKKQ